MQEKSKKTCVYRIFCVILQRNSKCIIVMRKISFILVAALISAMPMNAQLFQSIGQAVKDVKKEQPKPQSSQPQQTQPVQQTQPKQAQPSSVQENKGQIYYVSANGRGRGADGLSP